MQEKEQQIMIQKGTVTLALFCRKPFTHPYPRHIHRYHVEFGLASYSIGTSVIKNEAHHREISFP